MTYDEFQNIKDIILAHMDGNACDEWYATDREIMAELLSKFEFSAYAAAKARAVRYEQYRALKAEFEGEQ